jgi:hypothetical protein
VVKLFLVVTNDHECSGSGECGRRDGLHCASACVTQDSNDNNWLGIPHMLCISKQSNVNQLASLYCRLCWDGLIIVILNKGDIPINFRSSFRLCIVYERCLLSSILIQNSVQQ